MAGVSVGSLYATLKVNTTQFATGLAGMGTKLKTFGSQLQTAGRSMTTYLTLPIVGIGGAIIKTSLDFDTALRRIVGLTSVTTEEIDGIREAILAMAAEVGKSPQELAEAFYFLASAGFTGAEALDVLKSAAMAGASGLGETSDIARVVGAAINAYGKENLTAAHSTDVLLAAVREGTADAPDFASALGTVLGSAAQIGATFDDVAAAMAAMTLKGIDADAAAVSLNQVFVSLFKPAAQARKGLEEVGLSAEGLRDQIKSEGLLSVLETLKAKFGDNVEATAAVFGNVRALRGVLSLTGGDAEVTAGIFGRVADSTGALAGAFADTEGPGRELDRAMVDVKATLIELGDTVLPMFVELLHGAREALAELRKWWDGLGEEGQKTAVTVAALVAVLGPLLIVVGLLVGALGALFSPIGLIIAAITLLGIAWATNFGGIQEIVAGVVDGAIEAFDNFKAGIEAVGRAVDDTIAWIGQLFADIGDAIGATMAAIAQTITDVWNAITETITAVMATITETITAVMATIAGVFEAVWGAIREAIRAVLTVILVIITIAMELWKATAGAFLDSLFGAITEVWNAIAGFIGEILATIGAIITTAFETVRDFVTEVWATISGAISSALATISGVVSAALAVISSTITTAFETVRAFVAGVWAKISAAIGAALAVIKGAISTAFGIVSGVVDSVMGTIRGVVETVWGIITGVFNAAKGAISSAMDGVTSVFRGAWDGLVGVVKGPLNLIIGLINGFIRFWNGIALKVPEVDLGPLGKIGGFTLGLPHINPIPRLETGTRDWTGGLALAGERGPELVDLPGHARVFPAGDTASILEALAGGGGGQTLIGQQIANQTIEAHSPAEVEAQVDRGLRRAALAWSLGR